MATPAPIRRPLGTLCSLSASLELHRCYSEGSRLPQGTLDEKSPYPVARLVHPTIGGLVGVQEGFDQLQRTVDVPADVMNEAR